MARRSAKGVDAKAPGQGTRVMGWGLMTRGWKGSSRDFLAVLIVFNPIKRLYILYIFFFIG